MQRWLTAGARSLDGSAKNRAGEELTRNFQDACQDLVSDPGLPTFAEVQSRRTEIEVVLSRVCDLAESIIAANRDIVDDGRAGYWPEYKAMIRSIARRQTAQNLS
jgi:hypothetical protein